MKTSPIRCLLAVLISAAIGFSSPVFGEDTTNMLSKAHDIVHQDLAQQANPPSDVQRIDLLTQALRLAQEAPNHQLKGHRVKAIQDIRAALAEVRKGDPDHKAHDYLCDADTELNTSVLLANNSNAPQAAVQTLAASTPPAPSALSATPEHVLQASPSGAIYCDLAEADGSSVRNVFFTTEETKKPQDGKSHHFAMKGQLGGDGLRHIIAAPLPFGSDYAIVVWRDNTFAISPSCHIDEKTAIQNVKVVIPEGKTIRCHFVDSEGTFARGLKFTTEYTVLWGTTHFEAGNLETDANGWLVIPHFNTDFPGEYRLRCESRATYVPLEVALDPRQTEQEIRVTRGRVITGIAKDAMTGKPIAGMGVYALYADCSKERRPTRSWNDWFDAEARTDSEGHFRFSNLPEGDFRLEVRSADFDDPNEPVTTRGGPKEPVILNLQPHPKRPVLSLSPAESARHDGVAALPQQTPPVATAPGSNAANASALSDQTQAVLNGKLIDIVKNVVTAAANGNYQKVGSALSQEYRESVEAFSGGSRDEGVLLDFNYYSIVGVEKVIVDKDIAFVVAKIAYRPDKLVGIAKEEKEMAATGAEGTLWTGCGGTSTSSKCEEGGVGLATYYLVLQGGAWKLHFTHFTLEPIPPGLLKNITGSMKTLVHK